MSSIKIEITLDSTQLHLLGPLGELLGAKQITMSGPNTVSIAAGHAEDLPKEEAKPAKAAAPKKTPAKAKPVEEIEVEIEEEETQAEEEQTVTVEDLKGLLAKKVSAHRRAIVKKLKELGALKISELETSDYQEMFDFMSKLK